LLEEPGVRGDGVVRMDDARLVDVDDDRRRFAKVRAGMGGMAASCEWRAGEWRAGARVTRVAVVRLQHERGLRSK